MKLRIKTETLLTNLNRGDSQRQVSGQDTMGTNRKSSIMGSLYDIGNFRYKHFTFYSCNKSDGDSSCESAPNITLDDFGRENDEIVNFLDRV